MTTRTRTPYRHAPGLALAAFTAATLAGCTLAPQPAPDPPPQTPTAEPTPTADPGTVFGQTVTYPDGLAVTLSEPEGFDPTSTAYTDANFPYYVKFTVTLTNDTKERFDPILTSVSLASGDTEGTPVYDVVQGLSNPPTTDILPGDTRSWVAAFGVTNPQDLTAEVQLGDFVHDPAIFTRETR